MGPHRVAEFVGRGLEVAPGGVQGGVAEQLLDLNHVGPVFEGGGGEGGAKAVHHRLSATCICGSDPWPYRGIETIDGPTPMGHEYAGIVEEVGSDVTTVKPGSSSSGRSSRPTTPARSAALATGAPASCIHRHLMNTIGKGRARADPARGRHPRRHARGHLRRPLPELPRRLRRARNRLVRRRRRRGLATPPRRHHHRLRVSWPPRGLEW